MANQKITVSEVRFASVTGQSVTLRLHAPFSVPTTLSPAVLCRLVLPRLPLSPSSRLLLGLLLEETRNDLPCQYTYAELGALLGWGVHTIVRAAAELRGAGLLFSRRVSFTSGRMSFNCTPLIRWTEDLLEQPIAPDAPEGTSTRSEPATPVIARPRRTKASRVKQAPSAAIPEEVRQAMAFRDEIVDDHPDWPAVAPNWRGLHGIPLPEDDIPSLSVPLHVKPWLGPIPKRTDGTYDLEKLLRMPHQLVTAANDGEALHLFCQEKGDRTNGPIEIAVDDPVVDASAEREATRALSGPTEHRDDGSFDFSSGTETAETDIGQDVHLNPDL